MRNVRYEGSVLSSLEELKQIEADRIAEEVAAIARAADAKRVAHEAAVQRAREEAEARVEAEHAARLAAIQAQQAAERKARLVLEAAEAAERARAAIELESARAFAESELARDEARRKRPRWMIALTLAAIAGAAGVAYLAIDAQRAADEARVEIQRNNAIIMEVAKLRADGRELGSAKAAVGAIHEQVDAKLEAANKRLADAEKKAKADKDRRDRDAIAERARIDAERAHQQWLRDRAGPIKIDAKCLSNAVCK
jgi:hypothetical protein